MNKVERLGSLLSDFRRQYTALLFTQQQFFTVAEEILHALRASPRRDDFHRLVRLGGADHILETDMPIAHAVVAHVCAEFGITSETMTSRARGQQVDTARSAAVLLAHELTRLPQHHLASIFKRERSNISFTIRTARRRLQRDADFAIRYTFLKGALLKPGALKVA